MTCRQGLLHEYIMCRPRMQTFVLFVAAGRCRTCLLFQTKQSAQQIAAVYRRIILCARCLLAVILLAAAKQ